MGETSSDTLKFRGGVVVSVDANSAFRTAERHLNCMKRKKNKKRRETVRR